MNTATKNQKTAGQQDGIVIEQCRFCGQTERVRDRLCLKCREELHHWSHDHFAGSGLEVPPEEIDVLSPETLQRWREWVKRMDGGGGSYGGGRMAAIDSIFDAAIVGMKNVRATKATVNKAVAKALRDLADQITQSR